MFLGYALQNLQSRSKSLRINHRVRALVSVRNITSLYLFTFSHLQTFSLLSTTYFFPRPFLSAYARLFSTLHLVLAKHSRLTKYTPLGSNFAPTAFYRSFQGVSDLIEGRESKVLLTKQLNSGWTYPYTSARVIALSPLTHKYYIQSLYKFLLLSLNSWFLWPRVFMPKTNYLNINNNLLLLKFANKYFFKIYNI